MTKYSTSSITSGLSKDNLFNGGGRIYKDSGPLVLYQRDAQLEDLTYDGEIWVGEGDFSLRNVKCKGIRLSRVKSLKVDKCITDGADVGIVGVGGSNIKVTNSVLRNHRIGIELSPGHPWTFEDEAKARGLLWEEGHQWQTGTNLCGVLETKGLGCRFLGNGTSRVFVKFGTGPATQWGITPYKLDSLPLKDNYVSVTGKLEARITDENELGFWVEAEGIFELGRTYQLDTFNPKYEVRNVVIDDNQFQDCWLAGTSFYSTNLVRITRNQVFGTPEDYEYGLEWARNALIEGNMSALWPGKDGRVRIGLIGRMEKVVVRDNISPLHYAPKGCEQIELVSDTDIFYPEGRSAWVEGPKPLSPEKPIDTEKTDN